MSPRQRPKKVTVAKKKNEFFFFFFFSIYTVVFFKSHMVANSFTVVIAQPTIALNLIAHNLNKKILAT